MPLSEPHNLQVNALPAGQMPNVGAVSTISMPVPYRGRVIGAGCTISAALSAPVTITVNKVNPAGSTPIGTITMPTAGSGPGSTYGMVISGSEIACSVEAFESLSFVSAGGGATAIGNFVAMIRGS